MSLQDLSTPLISINADIAREYIKTHKEGTFTILDVRQPEEYREQHIPGAQLIPLPELADSLDLLDRNKPVFVYWAKGGRSQVASKLLSGQGFKEVYNLEGGISVWNGLTAAGPKEFHLKFLDKGARPEQMILLAYQMEDALRQFYVEAQKKSPDQELAAAFANLADVEEQHKQDIIDICTRIGIIAPREQDAPSRIMEGGFDTMSFFRQNEDFLKTSTGALSLAMMVETQSLDLYLRLAQEVTDNTAKQFLLTMGDREKEHLRTLAGLFVQKR